MSTPEYEVTVWQRVPAQSDPPTFAELDPIAAWQGIRWERALNTPDAFVVSAQCNALPSTIATPLTTLAQTPLELQVRRNGTVVARGPIIDYQIQGPTITLNARGILYYLDYMVVEGAFSRDRDDQATIVKDLIDEYQALDYGDYGLDTSSLTAVGIERSMTIAVGEFPVIGEKITQWSDNLNGMDIWADPATREILAAYPTRGVDRTGSVILDARVIESNGLQVSVAAGLLASEGFATSDAVAGSDGTVVIGTYSDTTLRSTFGRCGAAESARSVQETTTIEAHAERIQKERAAPALSLDPGQFVGVSGVDVGDFDTGDLVGFVYDAGLGLVETEVRISQWAVDVSPTREMLEVRFA